ncbi:MAG: hypothetical protein HFG70_13230 [Hungatella sp.]|nr:hypothetical protein [Hungatella sp.]
MDSVVITLDRSACILLINALNTYQQSLDDRYRHSCYFFKQFTEQRRKQLSEDNAAALLARMHQVDCLKSTILSSMPVEISMD